MTGLQRTFLLPDLGEGLTEAVIVRWFVREGDAVAADQPIAEVETNKAVVEVPSPRAGTVAVLHGQPGEVVAVGAPFLSFDSGEDAPAPGSPAVGPTDALVGFGPTSASTRPRHPFRRAEQRARDERGGAAGVTGATPAVVSPVVRRLALDLGVDLSTTVGTGPGGLILRSDVERSAALSLDAASSQPIEDQVGRSSTSQRAAVAKLIRSRREIPDVTTWVDVDASGFLAAKAALTATTDEPVSLLGLLGRICVVGLTRFPLLNGRYDVDNDTVIPHERVNLGVAVASSRGLIVPVIRDADQLTTAELCRRLAATVERAREGVLGAGQLTGGTFTLNNYGNFNVDGSTPIINYPEAAILGIGRIMDRAWVVDGAVVARPVVTLSLAYDHRVCDGREASEFLGFVRGCIAAPGDVFG